MRKKLLLIVILLFSIGIYAQRSIYFKVDLSEDFVFLYPTNGMTIQGAQPPYDKPISLKQEKEAIQDIQNLLKEKFPEVSDEDFEILRRVSYKIYFSGKGKVTYYYIVFPRQNIDSFPRFEEQLYEVGETLSSWDFSKYGLNIYSPDEVSKRIGIITFPLMLLRIK